MAQQTNVLLIIADDLGIDSLSAFNTDAAASLPPTPAIDNIQSNGITFTRFYSYSTCSPTRSAILTGRYAFRTGVYSPQDNDLMVNEHTLPDALLESGVISNRLAQIGKWHLGNDAAAPNAVGGWPHFSGALGGGLSSYTNWQKTVNGTTTAGYTTYATTDNVNDSIAWINQQGTNSWFLWLAFNAPHTPLHRPPDELHSYLTISDNPGRRSRPHYEAMIEAMDTEIERLLSNVDPSVTTVIFMGDNGTPGGVLQPPLPSGHGKGSIYDGGVRVPLIIRGAAVGAGLEGSTHDGVVHSVDLYATILDLFGVEAEDVVPEEVVLDSRSFAEVLRGGAYTRKPADITVSNVRNQLDERAIVEEDYKFIDFGGGVHGFYDVAAELAETNNLLDGVLSPAEQAAYEKLADKLETYFNSPYCHSAYMDGDGKFNVEIGWFADAAFTLYRTDNLVSNHWDLVTGQEFENSGEPVLILRDPTPPGSNAYYRVESS
jgi:arylsulfatase A-like enzyme